MKHCVLISIPDDGKRRYQEGDQQENLVVVLVFSCAVPSAVGWSN
jgi:hypothetical protein